VHLVLVAGCSCLVGQSLGCFRTMSNINSFRWLLRVPRVAIGVKLQSDTDGCRSDTAESGVVHEGAEIAERGRV
jgi:hypothetical protein